MARALLTCLLAITAIGGCGSDREAAPPEVAVAGAVGDGEREPRPAADGPRTGTSEAGSPEGLPAGSTPSALAEAITLELPVTASAHPVPEGAPAAVVRLPRGWRPEAPHQVAVFLHGWRGCARVLAHAGRVGCIDGGPAQPGWGLMDRHEESGSRAILIVPQLSWMARSGSPGRFAEGGGFRSFLEELWERLRSDVPLPLPPIDALTVALVAHSAGGKTAEALVRHGGVDVERVVLLDALYDDGGPFAGWLLSGSGRRLVSIFGSRGEPRHHTHLLVDRVRSRGGRDAAALISVEDLRASVPRHPMVAAESPHPHGALPRRHLAEVLSALDAAAAF